MIKGFLLFKLLRLLLGLLRYVKKINSSRWTLAFVAVPSTVKSE